MSSQVAGAFLAVLAEVERMDAPSHAKHQLKAFINETCHTAGITVIGRKERVQFARRLLDNGEPRPIIRDRLMIRFGIGRASAYNAIDAALQLSKAIRNFGR